MFRIYQTPAMPRHYVVADHDGKRYLVAAIKGGWKGRKTYKGKHALLRVSGLESGKVGRLLTLPRSWELAGVGGQEEG